jgi:hypothetical protein
MNDFQYEKMPMTEYDESVTLIDGCWLLRISPISAFMKR